MIIDATDMILGRLATFAAKQALLGEKVDIINCDKAIITGSKKQILAKYKQKREMGRPTKGPFIHRQSDRFVRRSIRGMLPYRQEKGLSAFKRIMCYNGVPAEFKDKVGKSQQSSSETGTKEITIVEKADMEKLPNLKFITVGEICKFMGGN